MPSHGGNASNGKHEDGEFYMKAIVLGDNDGVYRSVTAEDPKTPTDDP